MELNLIISLLFLSVIFPQLEYDLNNNIEKNIAIIQNDNINPNFELISNITENIIYQLKIIII